MWLDDRARVAVAEASHAAANRLAVGELDPAVDVRSLDRNPTLAAGLAEELVAASDDWVVEVVVELAAEYVEEE